MKPQRTKLPARGATSLRLLLFLPALLALGSSSCQNDSSGSLPPPTTTSGSQTPVARATEANAARPAFDGSRAFEHVRRMVEMGPRHAGSAELARTREYIVNELRSAGLKVSTDEWDAQTPTGARRMANVLAELPGKSPDAIIVASHYDTKAIKGIRFLGANDGGSSTGTLIEIARALAATKQQPALTYWFVFFDGEEAVCNGWDECRTPDDQPDNTYGSRRFVARLTEQGQKDRARAMILLDMVGYKNLKLARDEMGTGWLKDIIWQTGKELGYQSVFVEGEEPVGGDDHEPFLRAGIHAVDLIQLTGYPYWHEATDTLDKISAKSLQAVGETVIASLPRVEKNVAR
ncbi:MAG: M28 family peptidase [Acidobacteria bacterium]|nr:M28 family peptidase [Acidobacteriota bacterium]